jgi:transposase
VKRGKKFRRVNVIDALCNEEYFAIECYKEKTNSKFFEGCLLEEIPKGCTVIMDKTTFHRKKRLRKLAGGTARLLFLPPYSPDYNPIEKSRANMKRNLCENLHRFQSVDSAIYDYFGLRKLF